MNINQINGLVLAYMGDAIYEQYIRDYLIKKGINKVNDLQKEAVKYVSAKGQADILNKLLALNYFTEEEQSIVKRARNSKSNSSPKNVDIITYKQATGLEALIGYLYFKDNISRIVDIMNRVIKL